MYDLNLPRSNAIPRLPATWRKWEGAIAEALRAGATTLGKGIAALAAAHARRRLRRDTARQLNTLPDRLLQDIGLPRSAIWQVASDLVSEATRTSHYPPRRSNVAQRPKAGHG